MNSRIFCTAPILMSLALVGCGTGADSETITRTVEAKSGTGSDFTTNSHSETLSPNTTPNGISVEVIITVVPTVETEAQAESESGAVAEDQALIARTNIPPTISGTPSIWAYEDETYHFTPDSADEDNDDLSFTIQNKPGWMEFDTTTGALSGTPSIDNVGDYSAITISVSDGQAVALLKSFDLTVQSTTATLSWAAPTTRIDGSPLPMSEIAGYKIYMGTNANNLSLAAHITDPYLMEYKISELSTGTYYFAVSTYTHDNLESGLSVIVSKSI